MREFLKSVLATEGFVVSEAANGEDSIKQALTLKPDLLLLDLRMPAPDGVAICKAVRGNEQTATIPILVVTGTMSREQIEESMSAGADDFVSKPINVRDLIIRVRAMLESKQIADPVDRLQHYLKTVREMTDKLPPPAGPDGRP
jgi:two-component system cell cycle response regulator